VQIRWSKIENKKVLILKDHIFYFIPCNQVYLQIFFIYVKIEAPGDIDNLFKINSNFMFPRYKNFNCRKMIQRTPSCNY